MKKLVMKVLPLAAVFFVGSGFAPAPAEDAMVLIDGKQVRPETTLTFDRDDTVFLEATGIKPNSIVHFKVKKLGIKWAEHEFDVDKTGEVKGVLHIPEEKIQVSCTVDYYSSDNQFHEVNFKFKTI